MIYSVFTFSVQLFCNDKVASFTKHRNTSLLWIVTKQSLEGLKIREKSEVFSPPTEPSILGLRWRPWWRRTLWSCRKYVQKEMWLFWGTGVVREECFFVVFLWFEEMARNSKNRLGLNHCETLSVDQASALPELEQQFQARSPSFQVPENMGYMLRPPWAPHYSFKKPAYTVHLKTNQQDNPPYAERQRIRLSHREKQPAKPAVHTAAAARRSWSHRVVTLSYFRCFTSIVIRREWLWSLPLSSSLICPLHCFNLFACLFALSLQLETEVELKNICIPVQSHCKGLQTSSS